ncbi:MAG: hypothetical protein Q9175_006356, partial [Cornicularia normoerica]
YSPKAPAATADPTNGRRGSCEKCNCTAPSKRLTGSSKRAKAFFPIGDERTIADITAGCMLGMMMDMVQRHFGLIEWKDEYAELRKWWEKLEGRARFRETRPVIFELR